MSTTSTDTPALSHLDETGQVRMVDVGGKASTPRIAIAEGRVRMSPAAYKLLSAQANAKGEVLNTARVAGILAAKRCAELIPLCHSLPRSEEHTSELQSLMRHSYAVFCLKKKNIN